MSSKSVKKIALKNVEDLWGDSNQESTSEIRLDQIQSFKGHPFKVKDDEKMQELVESIRENGILTPVLVRPSEDDRFEMVSGHRRMHAASLLQMEEIPAIIREMDDDEAIKMMVNANVQREEILPSEKAYAYKMLLEAMKRQAGRPKKNTCQDGTNLRSDEELSEQVGESARNIQRYIRLTELIPELLDMVDLKRINFTMGVNISYLSKETQTYVYKYIREKGMIRPEQITALRELEKASELNSTQIMDILNGSIPEKKTARKVSMNEKKLSKYFPPTYTSKDMEQVIESLLEKWKQEQDML